MGLKLTWHNVVHMYKCNSLADSRYYLKSRSNKGMKDDYLIASREWHDGLHCLTKDGEPGGVP